MSKLSAILLAVAALHGGLLAVNPMQKVSIEGVVAHLPEGAAWVQTESSPKRVLFEHPSDGAPLRISFSTETIELLPDDRDFFRFAESKQEKAFSKLRMVSLHFNWVREKGVACVRYDGIFEDTTVGVNAFVTLKGELCRHPRRGTDLIQVELSQRSNTSEAAYKVDLTETAQHVFDHIDFVEPPNRNH